MNRFFEKVKSLVDGFASRNASAAIYAYILCAIISLPTVIYYVRIEALIYAIYVILFCFLLCSLISAFLSANYRIFKFIKLILASLLLFVCLVFINGQLRFGLALPIDSLAPIAQTNAAEVKEFIGSNILLVICAVFCLILILGILYYLIFTEIKNKYFTRLLAYSQAVLFILSAAALLRNPSVVNDYRNCNNIALVFENSADLREHLTNPDVIETLEDHPQDIVIILGESFSKYHSSLYGYSKETNPCLQRYVDDGNMVVFDSVSSPEVSTTPTFKYLLNTHTRAKTSKWYESTTIQEYFKLAGYHLTWISNQQQFGALNNISSGQSVLCDESYFHGGEGQTKDMVVVDTYKKLSLCSDKNLIFFHLYGQHPEFDRRYPDTFSKFKPSEYIAPPNQQAILAAYDNATLYNDSVVAAILSCFKEKDAIVVYLADHGLDLFYTDDHYCAHGKPSDPESYNMATQVPFMVFMSDSFRSKHPKLVSIVEGAKCEPFCTEMFFYRLLNFCGYIFAENGDKK